MSIVGARDVKDSTRMEEMRGRVTFKYAVWLTKGTPIQSTLVGWVR